MLKKILVGLLLLILVLIVAAVIAIKVMLTPERIRATVIPLVEKEIHRKMDYRDITIGIFSGISISDLKILDQNGKDEFVSVKTMAMHYRFRPLLSGKIEISEIVLDQPQISIIRLEDGSFNFSDILSSPETGKKEPEAKKEEKSESNLDILVEDLRIADGELRFEDRFLNKKTPLKYVLNKFNLKTSHFSLEKPFPFDLSALVSGAEFALSGNFDVKKFEGDLAIKLEAFDLLPFSPYFAESIPGKLSSAKVSTKLEATLKADALTSRGDLTISQINLVLDDLKEAPLENASLGFDYDILFDSVKKNLNIASVHLTLNGVGASGKGSLDLAPETPVLDFILSLKELDLGELMQKAPAGLVRDYQEYGLTGKVSGEVVLKGLVDSGAGLLKSAALDLKEVSAAVNGTRTGLNGKLNYAANKLKTEGIDFHYADQHGKLTLDMDYLAGKKPLVRGNFAITADKLDLNKLIPEETGGTSGAGSGSGSGSTPSSQPTAKAPAQETVAATEIGPLDLPLDIKGILSVKEMLYRKLSITKSEVDLSLKNNLLTIEKLTGETAGGTLNANAKVNLAVKGLSYEGKVNLGETDVPAVIAGLLPDVKLHIEGKAKADAHFSGAGTIPENLLSALQVSGKASILDGLVKDTEIQNAIALFFGLSELKLVSFESLTSDFSLKNKIMNQESFLDSSKLQVKSTGTVSLDGPLNLAFNSRFSPELMEKSKGPQADVAKHLADEKGWGGFALTVKGTMDKPKIGLDTSGFKKQAEETVKEKLKEKLTEKLSGKPATGAESAEGAGASAKGSGDAKKDAAKDALKNLLNLPGKK